MCGDDTDGHRRRDNQEKEDVSEKKSPGAQRSVTEQRPAGEASESYQEEDHLLSRAVLSPGKRGRDHHHPSSEQTFLYQ